MEQSVNSTKGLLKGAAILTAAALIIKVLSAVYRVPFQNIVGDVGFYIYQQVYPFYGIVIILCTYGFPVIISKLYAECVTKNNDLYLNSLKKAAFITLMIIGVVLFASLNLFASKIALLMKDTNLTPLIKAASFGFLLFPAIAFLRGLHQGNGNMIPTAISQVAEQTVRVTAILVVAIFLTKSGSSLYNIGAGAIYSSVAGLFVSALILIFYSVRKNNVNNFIRIKTDQKVVKKYVKIILIHGTAACLSGMLLIFLQLADALNLYALLVSSGIGEVEAKSMKGVYDRGLPLIQLGTIVATSISLAVIPFISNAKARNDINFLKDKIRLTLQLSIIIGVGASAGLLSIIEPTNIMLFKNSTGSNVLAILSLIIAFSSIIMTVVAILQGLGYPLFPAFVILCGAILKYSFNYLFVPTIGTTGGAIASLISLLIVLICLIFKLKKETKTTFLSKRFLFVVSLATAFLVIILKAYLSTTSFLFNFNSERISATVQALSAVLIGGFIYIVIIIRSRLFKNEELLLLPFVNKLKFLLPKRID